MSVIETRIWGWKGIAQYFGLSGDRTVRRWAKEHQLPIHRGPGNPGRVFAVTDELLKWEIERKKKRRCPHMS
jgi:hypothetical protein